MRRTLLGLNRELEVLVRRVALAERRAKSTRSHLEIADVNLEAGRGSLGQSLVARERHLQDSTLAIGLRFAQLEVWARLHRALGRLASTLAGEAAARP